MARDFVDEWQPRLGVNSLGGNACLMGVASGPLVVIQRADIGDLIDQLVAFADRYGSNVTITEETRNRVGRFRIKYGKPKTP